MPKELYIARYSLIIKRLEKGPATFEQITLFLETQSSILDMDFAISKRTFQRDIKDIFTQLNIEIVNERKGDKRYYIKSKPETQNHSNRLLESYQIMSTIEASRKYSNLVFLENRRPQGIENFHGILHAIQNKLILSFERKPPSNTIL
jgi:hypothetical protein